MSSAVGIGNYYYNVPDYMDLTEKTTNSDEEYSTEEISSSEEEYPDDTTFEYYNYLSM